MSVFIRVSVMKITCEKNNDFYVESHLHVSKFTGEYVTLLFEIIPLFWYFLFLLHFCKLNCTVVHGRAKFTILQKEYEIE
jgi:hypothetical protein